MTQADVELPGETPPAARGLLLAMGTNAFGFGTTVPFILIYLNTVQNLSLTVVSVAISFSGIAALLIGPLAGSAMDRFGPKSVYLAAAVLKISGAVLLIVMDHPWHAFLALAINAAGDSTTRSALSTMLTNVSAPAIRQKVFSLQFMLFNAGMGCGGLLGGFLVDVERGSSFALLFVIDALGFIAGASIITLVKTGHHGEVRTEKIGEAPFSGWRVVLADPAMRWVCCVFFLIGAFGYAQLNNGIPVFALNIADVSTRTLGFAFAVATAVIVVAQLGAMRLLDGHRRTRAMAGFGLFASFAFLLLGISGLAPAILATGLVIASTAVFALGETLWWPTANAIIGEIAPTHLRGRYISLSTMTWSAAMATGPLLVGFMFDAGLAWLYIIIIVAGGFAVFWAAHQIRNYITSVQDGLKPLPLTFIPTPVWAKVSTRDTALPENKTDTPPEPQAILTAPEKSLHIEVTVLEDLLAPREHPRFDLRKIRNKARSRAQSHRS